MTNQQDAGDEGWLKLAEELRVPIFGGEDRGRYSLVFVERHDLAALLAAARRARNLEERVHELEALVKEATPLMGWLSRLLSYDLKPVVMAQEWLNHADLLPATGKAEAG